MRTVGEYCDGSGFMMTSQVGRSIVREAEITKSYSDENLYITGILRNGGIIHQVRDRRTEIFTPHHGWRANRLMKKCGLS